jgi:hypothetical protein
MDDLHNLADELTNITNSYIENTGQQSRSDSLCKFY